jgi:hypothetical protein
MNIHVMTEYGLEAESNPIPRLIMEKMGIRTFFIYYILYWGVTSLIILLWKSRPSLSMAVVNLSIYFTNWFWDSSVYFGLNWFVFGVLQGSVLYFRILQAVFTIASVFFFRYVTDNWNVNLNG